MSNPIEDEYVIVDDKYKLLEEVGDGSTSTVFKALCTQDSSIVALKIGSSASECCFEKEFEATRLFDHPGIAKYIDYAPEGIHSTYKKAACENTRKAEYLVAPFYEGSDLFNFV